MLGLNAVIQKLKQKTAFVELFFSFNIHNRTWVRSLDVDNEVPKVIKYFQPLV